MCVTVKRLPSYALEFFRAQGAKGGRIGGKRSLQTMTADELIARATKASKAAAKARKPRAKKSPKTTRRRAGSGNGAVV